MNKMLAVGALMVVLGLRRIYAHRKDGDRVMLVEWLFYAATGLFVIFSNL